MRVRRASAGSLRVRGRYLHLRRGRCGGSRRVLSSASGADLVVVVVIRELALVGDIVVIFGKLLVRGVHSCGARFRQRQAPVRAVPKMQRV